MKINKKNQKGQSLIVLLFFVTISTAIITAIVFMVFNSVVSSSNVETGTLSYYAAEAGAENALLRLLRDTTYTGETMAVGDATVVIQVSGGVITSTATYLGSVRKIEVQTVYNNNVLTISSWKEIN